MCDDEFGEDHGCGENMIYTHDILADGAEITVNHND